MLRDLLVVSKTPASIICKSDIDSEMGTFSNYRLLVPYILPYVAYVVIASLFSSLAPEWNYLIRIFVVAITLYWAWRWYIPFDKVFYEKSLNDFKPGEWSYFAIIFSTVAFAMGHQVMAWPAAIIYGFLMAGLWVPLGYT